MREKGGHNKGNQEIFNGAFRPVENGTIKSEEFAPECSAILERVIGLFGSERVLNRLLVIEDDERVDIVALIPGDPRPSDSCFALLVEGFFATTEK
jgi:hypothetical protein